MLGVLTPCGNPNEVSLDYRECLHDLIGGLLAPHRLMTYRQIGEPHEVGL
jgi:hypothetical protein